MLETPIIMRVSDIESAIEDYKFGLYSDAEFIKVLKVKTQKLAVELTEQK